MHFTDAHIDFAGSACVAVMTQHFAQKCLGDAANAVMSAHLAAKCSSDSFDDKIYYRYL